MTTQLPSKERLAHIANFHRAMTLPPSHDEIEAMARALLAAHEQEPVADVVAWSHPTEERACDVRLRRFDLKPVALYYHPAPSIPVAVPDAMLCDFYEVDNWQDLVRELVGHVEQLQDSMRRNVKPWEDTLPETLLPAYIERIKNADNVCRAAMLQSEAVSQPYKLPDGYCVMPCKLSAENGAKGALSGEFHVTHRIVCQSCGGEGCEDCNEEGGWDGEILIGWDIIKQIHEASVEACALPAALKGV